jgi:hypothetical protein
MTQARKADRILVAATSVSVMVSFAQDHAQRSHATYLKNIPEGE